MLKITAVFGVLFSLAVFGQLKPEFSSRDAKRPRIVVGLKEWASALPQLTEIAFVPGKSDRVLVLLKEGDLFSLSRAKPSERVKLLHLDVLTSSELGLLGIAFHPRFEKNRKIYLNYNPTTGEQRTRVSEWVLPTDTSPPEKERVLLEIPQPYPNHDGGKLVFGPDGMLYIGMGDGGQGGDPHNHGQRGESLLGKMLRIDVDGRTGTKPYGIPGDNPFVLNKKFAPEVWALGLRNPWRFTFDPRGRLIAADVGQNKWEEVTFVEAGGNYGWRLKEASHCFNPDKNCASKESVDPWIEYGREDGGSITGGYVYAGSAIAALKGKYVFGDFVSGRIWAADLPSSANQSIATHDFSSLGRWPLLISTFGQGPDGEIYVSDFAKGLIFLITPP